MVQRRAPMTLYKEDVLENAKLIVSKAFNSKLTSTAIPLSQRKYLKGTSGANRVHISELLELEEKRFIADAKYANQKDTLYIYPSEGFRRINLQLNGKTILTTRKFNLFSDPHKFSYHFFATKAPMINANFFKTPMVDTNSLKKLLCNMGIPALFHDYFISKRKMPYKHNHQLTTAEINRSFYYLKTINYKNNS